MTRMTRKGLLGTDPCDALVVGDGATHTIWTDRHAGTIIARTPLRITWQRDKAYLTKSSTRMSDTGQQYLYTADPNGAVVVFSRRYTREGEVTWKPIGDRTRSPGGYLSAGRCEHYDPNF